MKSTVVAVALSAGFCLAAKAAVTPINPGGNVFLDKAHGLLWSQPDAFAANSYAGAQAAVSSATIEGFSDWQLPSIQQFRWLYQTQGTVATGNPDPNYDEIMVELPFSGMKTTWYWSTDVFSSPDSENLAFSPTNANTNPYFLGTRVNVWAVHEYPTIAVPEPGTAVLAFMGLMATLASVKLRKSKSPA